VTLKYEELGVRTGQRIRVALRDTGSQSEDRQAEFLPHLEMELK
jgi:hypothetical protein